MDRVTQRLWRGVEEPVLSVAVGTSALLDLPKLLRAFRPPGLPQIFRDLLSHCFPALMAPRGAS
jgi:hypothetical protein